MKKRIFVFTLIILLISVLTGCGSDKTNYTYEYDIYVNGKNINSKVITSSGSTKNYVEYVNHGTYTTDLNLTFVIYETPVRESQIDADKLLKDSFNVKTIYNHFKYSEATIEKVKIGDVEYNKYSITYTFDDIGQMDIITINFGTDVIKNLNLTDKSFEIRFIV